MNKTPYDIIILYKNYNKILFSNYTSIQKEDMKNALLNDGNRLIKWEIIVEDIAKPYYEELNDYVIYGKTKLYDFWSWLRGNEYNGWFKIQARLVGKIPREKITSINRGQRIWIEGEVSFFSRTFLIENARLIEDS